MHLLSKIINFGLKYNTMSIGSKIKQLRELRNFTQAHMAERLNMSVGGYCKIEKDQTDVSLSKIEQIAAILETDLGTLLNFDSKQVFNQYNNYNSVITGHIHEQMINGNLRDILNDLQNQINALRNEIKVKYGKENKLDAG